MTEKRYISKVITDEETGELAFILPEELMIALDLVEGGYLLWTIAEDGKSITFEKSKLIDVKG